MSGDAYVQSVIDFVPRGLPLRDQIAMELRSHIAERTQEGRSLDEVLQQLGDPLTLAESYLAAVPLRSATVGRRLVAKGIDVLLVLGIVAPIGAAGAMWLPEPAVYFVPMLAIFFGLIAFSVYTATAEYRAGGTLGKQLMGIRVVRESGARIGLGQAWLRQLPFFGQFFFIDALFALFTERRQRAFELLTKTRAVVLLGVGLIVRS
jgi:uncharacterized RDD family membrane protein YckC